MFQPKYKFFSTIENEPELLPIQQTTKYETAISFSLQGNFEKAIKFLNELKKELAEENNTNSEDNIFLLKKIITMNEISKKNNENTPLLKELDNTIRKKFNTDFNRLFEEIEYICLIYMNIDPKIALEYIEDILEDQVLPAFFDNILKYYLAVIQNKIDLSSFRGKGFRKSNKTLF